jgi:UDP-GlcNAc3NAcA epimerase
MKKKILSIIGARPQFIKHFPLELELRKEVELISLHTGQHYDDKMSNVFFEELAISRPNYLLTLLNSSHAGQTGEMLVAIEEVLIKEKPNAVLVYGDTNSTLAGSLAAAKLNIPIIHVEAGLRSFNKQMPEEINRIITDHLSSLLFCSSEVGAINLKKEGIINGVFLTGDLMKDAQYNIMDKLQDAIPGNYIYVTIHRPYNTDDIDRLLNILSTLNHIGKKIIFPVHPRTRKMLEKSNTILNQFKNISFIKPVGYIDSLRYQNNADCVITDSGGIQKEAYWFKTKCITLRSETEWTETLNGDWNQLIFNDLSQLTQAINTLPNEDLYNNNLYGNGNAAEQICLEIKNYLNIGTIS